MAASSSGAIRAGRAFVEMFVDSTKLVRALEFAKSKVLAFGKLLGTIGAGAAAIGATALTPLTKFFAEAVSEGAAVDRMAKKWGATAEAVSSLQGAFAVAGIGADEFESILDGLNSKINDATTNYEQLWRAASAPRGMDLYGKGPQEQLEAVFAAFEKINKADRGDVAEQLGMKKLLPYLEQGLPGLRELERLQKEQFKGWSKSDAEAATKLSKEFDYTLNSLKATVLEIGKALLPTGKDFGTVGEEIRGALQSVREWIASNRETVIAVAAAAGALVAGGIAIAGFGAAVAALAPVITGLVIAIKAVVGGFLLLFNPVTWAVAAFAAVAAGIGYLVLQTEEAQECLADLQEAFGMAADFIKSSWKGIGDAIKAGDFTLAFRIGVKAAEVAWKEFVFGITAAWVGFKSDFVDAWEDATGWLAKRMVDVMEIITRTVMGAIRKVVEGFNSIAGAIDDSLKIDVPGLVGDDAIKNEGNQLRAEIDKQTAEEKKRRAEFRMGQLLDAKKSKDIALEELEILKKQAEEAAKRVEADKGPKNVVEKPKPPPIPSGAALSEQSKGLFGGPTQQALAYGDNVGQRQLDTQNGIRDNTAETNKILERIAAMPRGLVLS